MTASSLVVQLTSKGGAGSSRSPTLGCFRLSVSDDPAAFEREHKRLAALRATEPWTKLAAAYALNGRTDEGARYFAKALQGAGGYEARKPILELAARFDDVLSALVQRRPDDLPVQLAFARKLAERGKQRLIEKQPAEALAELQKSRAIFTRLHAQQQWKVLTPVELKTENGSKLELQKDGSIFVDQPADKDTYSLVFQTELKGIKGLRLEALADARLPGGGPGWNPVAPYIGNFVLSDLWLQAASAGSPDQPRSIVLRNAWADFSQVTDGGYDVGETVDGNINVNRGWAVHPQYNKDHVAVFDTAEAVGDGQATRLTVRLNHQYTRDKFVLGRFRLSFTNDAATLPAARSGLDLKDSEVMDVNLALATAQAQQGHIDDAVASFTAALGLAVDRADNAKVIAAAAPLPGVLKKLAEHAAGNAQFQSELARHHAEQGNAPLANAARTKARTLFERQLAKEPENAGLAAELTDALLIGTTHWTVLTPAEMKTAAGATLTLQEDGSIFVSGKLEAKETYTLDFKNITGKMRAIRLEALRDDRLPNGGPGTFPGGLFVLSHLAVFRADEKDPAAMKPVPLRAVFATFEERPAQSSLTGEDPNGGWSISGATGKSHSAIFAIDPYQDRNDTNRLRIVFDFHHGVQALVGRFRLSISSDDPSAIVSEQLAATKTTDPWVKLAAAYAVNGRTDEAAQYFGKALQRADGYEAEKPILELAARFDDVLAALVQRRPDDLPVQLAFARKLTERGRQRLAEKQPAEALAALQKSREILTRLRAEPKWTVLTPTEMKSDGGEKFTVEKDSSIFVSGPTPDRTMYTLKLATDLASLTAIRLDTIPDARLPDGGAGRHWNGNFHVSEFTAAIVSGQADAKPTPLVFASVIADFQQSENEAPKFMIDGNANTRWDSWPKMREAHWAVFDLKSPARMAGGSLSITLDSGIAEWKKHGLGRFRLSATNEADAFVRTALRNDLKDSEVVDLNIALAKAQAQQGHIDAAVALFTEAIALAVDRADKAKIIAAAAPLPGVLKKLDDGAAGNAQFQTELARYFAEQANAPLANAARTKARALFEAKLAKEPENAALATELADLLLIDTTPCPVLKPTEMKSEGGATLALQPDGSVLASGINPDRDVYVIKAEFQGRIGAVRLDTIPDASMPKGGCGRADSGNFILSDFRVTAGESGVTWSRAYADFSQESPNQRNHHPIAFAIDADESTGWAIVPRAAEAHVAVFIPSRLIATEGKIPLRIRLAFQNKDWSKHTLGRFRLSVCDEPAAAEREQRRFAALRATEPWTKLAAAYAVNEQNDAAVKYFSKALEGADGYEAKKAIFEQMLLYDKVVDSFIKRYPEDAQLQLALARNLSARGKTALAAEKPAEALTALKQAQDIFTRLLSPVADWTVLTPIDMKTEKGAKLESEKDGSIIASQPPKNDTYSLVFQTELKGIKGLRLEALADSRLPSGGPGLAGDGNFVLSKLSLQAAPAKSPDQSRSIALRNASADFSQVDYNVRGALDGNSTTGWAVWPKLNKDHVAVFDTAEEVGDGQATRLTVQLSHQWSGEKYLLGRFRLSFTNDAATLQVTRIRLDLKDSELIDLHVSLGKAYAQQGQSDEAVAAFTRALALAKDRADKARIITEAVPQQSVLEKLAERADNADRVIFAQAAYDRKKFAYATRLWAEALANDPKLGDDRQNQYGYHAARAAAMAVAGQGKDEPPLDDAAKAKLRGQALDWLKAELSVWSKEPPGLAIAQILWHWQQDSDLGGIRDAAALAKLPADEQKAFTQFWADVAEVLTKADGGFHALPAAEQVEEVRTELKKRNPGYDGKLTPTIEQDAVTGLNLDNSQNVSDLTPLKGMPLKTLSLMNTGVTDLTPLKGMPLETLMLWNWHGSDLTPLKGMPLKWLNCGGGNQKIDLTPLAGLPLEFLCINSTQVSDLAPLKDMPLTELLFENTLVSDLAPLRGTHLHRLYIHKTKVSDLAPIKGMPLKELAIEGTSVTDLSPLKDMPLQQIRLTPKNITQGLDILRDMKSLKTIGIGDNQVWPAAEFWNRYDQGEFNK